MPTIELNRKELEKIIGKISDEKLKDRISMMGTDLEEVTKDKIIVEIFPNRPDLLSLQGFGRALSSFINKTKGLTKYEVRKSDYKLIVDKSVKEIRPFTACAVVKGLKFDDEKIKDIIQIQEKLHITYGRKRKKAAIGIYPLEAIKFPIIYKADDPKKFKFLPLEGKREMTGLQILSQHPTGREYGYLLEGLKKFPYFIDSNNEILSMPPIINSHKTGKITEKTTDVFIECSGFDLKTLQVCLNIIVTALADMGGKIYNVEMQYDKKINSPDLTPKRMKFDKNYAEKIIGVKISDNDLKNYLERMGFGIEGKNVLIPAYRADILHPIDLVEDISIAYGYENLVSEIPKVATIGKENKFEKYKNKISILMIGLGFYEVNNFSLIGEEDLKNMNIDYPAIQIINSNKEFNCLRNWIIPSLIKNLQTNQMHELPQKLFEIGRCFKKGNTETGVEEFFRLGAVIAGETDFTEIKQTIVSILESLSLNYEFEETKHDSFISGRVARVSVNKKEVAFVGEIHPKVLENFDLKVPVTAFELNLSDIYEI